METLIKEHEKLAANANLSKSLDDVQRTIDSLVAARDSIQSAPSEASLVLAKLQNPIKQSFENLNNDLKEVYKGQTRYQKALESKFKDKPFPNAENDVLSKQPGLINRAIAMHLLREGQFSVASQFLLDVTSRGQPAPDVGTDTSEAMLDEALGIDSLKSEDLRKAFADMYHILHEMQDRRNLLPAIAWAKENSEKLELRGSNLEFTLSQMQFVHLFNTYLTNRQTASPSMTDDGASSTPADRYEALLYARNNFASFQSRYLDEISQLASAMAFHPRLSTSPYRHIFLNNDSWAHLATEFTKEFCSLLGLSASSPLYLAATAGAISLPTLLKLQTIMKDKRAEWTTAQELPVEIPLPPSYLFHSIFVCPVSKEQTTDENPPMMMPCGHVVAQETLARMSKGTRFKCPYCPMESLPKEARKLYL